MQNSIVTFTLLLVLTQSMTLAQYKQLEKQKPESLFSTLDLPEAQNYPSLQKLVFITPWNNDGYEYTEKYVSKLDFISPCWYSLMLNSKGQPIFENQHNYHQSYVSRLRAASNRVKLVPRVYVQGTQSSFFQAIGSDRQKFIQAVELIKKVIQVKGLDGIVWDTPYNFFQKSRSSLNSLIVQFLTVLKQHLSPSKLIFFNMANPMDHFQTLDIANYQKLPIDYLLIQNYDKRASYLTMIEKSIEWKVKLTQKAKLILMLPFFSVNANTGQSVSTSEAREAMKGGVVSWRVSQGMCLYGGKERKRYIVPCFNYFSSAFELAEGSNSGVGFWEGGNGLQNYYKFL